jgi:protease PrsW
METCEVISLIPGPLVAIVLYLLLRYKYPNGRFGLFFKAFVLGVAGILLVFAIDKLINLLHLNSLHSLNRTLFYSFVLTAGIFELWKFLVLKLLVYPSKHVAKTIDVILYSIIIAAGFTTSYSVYALFYAPSYIDVCLYALTIGPLFVSIAIIMGYFSGIAINRQYPVIDLTIGLFLAITFHGIYRFCLLTTDRILMYMAIGGMLVTGITLLVISLKEASESD